MGGGEIVLSGESEEVGGGKSFIHSVKTEYLCVISSGTYDLVEEIVILAHKYQGTVDVLWESEKQKVL